jgi:hypothetical protein
MVEPKLGDVIRTSTGRFPRVISIDGHFIKLEYPRKSEDDPEIKRWIRTPNNYVVVDHA